MGQGEEKIISVPRISIIAGHKAGNISSYAPNWGSSYGNISEMGQGEAKKISVPRKLTIAKYKQENISREI